MSVYLLDDVCVYSKFVVSFFVVGYCVLWVGLWYSYFKDEVDFDFWIIYYLLLLVWSKFDCLRFVG